MDLSEKREREKKVMSRMVEIYCKGNRHHSNKKELCPSCKEMLAYSNMRTEKCPVMETKTFCNRCTIQCYKPAVKAEVSKVMRYAGPRMLFHHPIILIQHAISDMKDKKRKKKN